MPAKTHREIRANSGRPLTAPAKDRRCPCLVARRDGCDFEFHRYLPATSLKKRDTDCMMDLEAEIPTASVWGSCGTSECESQRNDFAQSRRGSPELRSPAPVAYSCS